MKNTHRRSFLQQAGAALAVTTVGTASAAGTMNRTSVALIGAGPGDPAGLDVPLGQRPENAEMGPAPGSAAGAHDA